MKGIMYDNHDAKHCINKAIFNNTIAYTFSYIGGFMIGYPVGTALGGGNPNWNFALIGCGFVCLSIPFMIWSDKNTLKAVNLYNSSFKNYSYNRKMDFNFGFCQNRLTFTMKF